METVTFGVEVIMLTQLERMRKKSKSISEIEGTVNYNYIIEHAAAMSGCFKVNERIISRQGKIIEIKSTDRGNYVVMEFDEDDPRA